MILVLLGTQHNEFTRLLQEVENCIDNQIIKEQVIVQAGFTKYKSDKMETFDMISKEELDKYMSKANLIITHGGVGSIIMALEKGKKVIAVPRLHEYGEHVNDHQRQIIKVFSEKKYLIGIENVDELEDAIKNIAKFEPAKYENNNQKMINIIENFIEKNIKSILYLDIISNCYNTLGYPTIKEIYIEDTSINSIKNDIEKLNIKIDIYSNNTTLYENICQ